MSVNVHSVRVRTSDGWQELALTGPQGPVGPAGPGLPTPTVNNQWIKGSGGVPIWSAITPADVGLPKVTTSTIAGGPPASPADKDIWIATAVDTVGTRWQFQYNAGSASAYKWEFIGGGRIFATTSIGTTETIVAASTWTDTTTIGPRFVLPRDGDYDVIGGAQFGSLGSGVLVQLGFAKGTAGPVVADASTLTASGISAISVGDRLTTCVAGTDIRLRYWSSVASGANTGNRWAFFVPVRIS